MAAATIYKVEGFYVEISDIREGSESVVLFILKDKSFDYIPDTLMGCMEKLQDMGFRDIQVVGATNSGALLHMRLYGDLFEYDYSYQPF